MSEVPWTRGICILCLEERPLTREHIIPEQIGGRLWVRFLCQSCNSQFGSTIESAVREDPSIRLAAENLENQLPGLMNAIREGLPYIGMGAGGDVRMRRRKGELYVQGGFQGDNSLILSPNHSREHAEAEARRRGYSPEGIAQMLRHFDDIPENVRAELMPGYEIINWRIDEVRPALDGPMLSKRVLLKMAYEFLACHVGGSIYERAEQLDIIRAALLANADPCMQVEELTSGRYQPIHGLALEDDEHAVVHICLFGWIHYRVHLLQVRTQPPMYAYTCNLLEGTERCEAIEEQR